MSEFGSVREGMTVISADGARVGRVMRCTSGRFEIEKGFFFPKDYLVDDSDVVRTDDKHAYLRLSREQLKARWDEAETFGDGADGTFAPASSERLAAGGAADFRPATHVGEEAYPTVARSVEGEKAKT